MRIHLHVCANFRMNIMNSVAPITKLNNTNINFLQYCARHSNYISFSNTYAIRPSGNATVYGFSNIISSVSTKINNQ